MKSRLFRGIFECFALFAFVLVTVVCAGAQSIGPNIDIVQEPVLAGSQACTPPACDKFNKMLETDIAASPLNPARAVAVFNDYRYSLQSGQSWCTVAYTKDSGYTWKNYAVPNLPGTPAQTSGNFCTDPAAVWDVLGTAHVVLLAGTSGNDTQVFVLNIPEKKDPSGDLDFNRLTVTRVDLGQNFTGTGLDKPSIAYFNGVIHVAYAIFDGSANRTKVMYARSVDNGASFSKPVKLNNTLKENNQTNIVIGADATVYVFWTTDDPTQSGIVFVRSTNAGQSFSTPNYVAGVPNAYFPYNQFAFPASTGFLSDRAEVAPTVIVAGPAPGVPTSKDRLLAAWTEYVNLSTGLPASPVDASGNVVAGVGPRIVITASFDQGATWVQRMAAQLGPLDAMQVKPRMATSGGLASLLFEDARGGGCAYSIPVGTGLNLPLMNGLTCKRNVMVAQASVASWTSGLPVFAGGQVVTKFPQKNGANVMRQANCAGGNCPAVYEPHHPSSSSGTIAFTGDYIGHSADHPLVKDAATGNWRLPLQPGDPQTFYAAWADNRWEKLPANSAGLPEENASLWGPYNPAACVNLGTRNTKPFFAKISPGLAAFWTGTDKPLQTSAATVVQIAVTIQNLTGVDRQVQVRLAQPNGAPTAEWSFSSSSLLTSFSTTIDRYSSVSKTLVRIPGSLSQSVQVTAIDTQGLTAGFLFNVSQTTLPVSGALNNLNIGQPTIHCLSSNTPCNGVQLKGTFSAKTQPSATFSFDTSGSGTFSFDTFSFDTFSFDTFSFDTGAFSDTPNQDVTWTVTGTGATVTPSDALAVIGNGGDLISAGYAFQLLFYKTYTIPDFVPGTCTPVGSPIDQGLSNIRIFNQAGATQIANRNAGTFSFDTFSFDTQAPSDQISNASFPVANGDQVNVTLRAYSPANFTSTTPVFNPTDPTNGVSQASVSQSLNTDGTRTAAFADNTVPTILSFVAPATNAAGWNNTNPTVTWTVQSKGSPITSASLASSNTAIVPNQAGVPVPGGFTCPASTVAQDTPRVTLTCSAANGGGNRNAASVTVRVDTVKPVVSAAATIAGSGTAYVPGSWTNQNVTVTFTCSDNPGGSGVASLTPAQTVSADGANQSVTGTCTDTAGNVATTTFSGINIDKTPPAITFAGQSPIANAAGWNNSNVTLTWTCSDSGSGPVSPAITQTITVEGLNLSATGTCTDMAGNQASSTRSGVNIDKQPPAITASISPAPAATGWYNASTGAPTITFVCADNTGGSGVAAGSCPTPVTLGEGANQSVFRTVADVAGNVSAPGGFSGINVDVTPPAAVIAAPADGSSYLLNAGVAAAYTCSDALSGIATCTGPVGAGSKFSTSAPGKKSFTVIATDKAGNTKSATATYYVIYSFVLASSKASANLGSAVPLNWQLTDANGTAINDLSSLVSMFSVFTPGVQPVNGVCPATYPGTTQVTLYSPATGATGGSNFRLVSGGYQFNWDSSTAVPTGQGCYTIVWQLKDNAGPAPGYSILNPGILHMTTVLLN